MPDERTWCDELAPVMGVSWEDAQHSLCSDNSQGVGTKGTIDSGQKYGARGGSEVCQAATERWRMVHMLNHL